MTRDEWERTPVDGAGLVPRAHAADLAQLLAVREDRLAILVAELRNALVPAKTALSTFDGPRAERARLCLDRLNYLADACAAYETARVKEK